MQYAIIDNFLDIDYFNSIKKIIMSDRFAWYFQDGITNPETGEEEESFYFTHNVYSEGVKSSLFTHLEILLQKLNVRTLIRIKANFYPNVNKFMENLSHVDYEEKHIAGILYLNNNNGYTRLNDKIKVDSLENRMLLFEGYKPHNSTLCTNTKGRFNINLNFNLEENFGEYYETIGTNY